MSIGRRSSMLAGMAFCLMFAGCSTKVMTVPTGGRGGIDQLLITQSADEALEALDLTQFAGQRLAVQAATMGDAQEYIRQGLVEKAVADGAIIVPEDEAEVIVVGKVQTAGTDKYDNPINLLTIFTSIFFRSVSKTGQVKVHVFAYRVGEPSQLVVMNQKARNTYSEFSLFVFGPFKTTTLKDWR